MGIRCRELNYYKFKLLEDYTIQTEIFDYNISVPYTTLTPDGKLTIHEGFAWDGATKAVNTKTIIRGSLVHDALYQLLRLGELPTSYKRYIDKLFRDICKEDGMVTFRAWYIHKAVKHLSGKHGVPGSEPYPVKILQVP